MRTKRKKLKGDQAELARVGKDEMNLAEYPTAILTTRSTDGVKTLRFQDSHGELTVTGSDAFGLPTAIDTDVLVALIEMTKNKNRFAEARVNFTRYELIRLIGWANVGSSYDRLKESLDRWAGVLLIYDGCWWDNRLKQYVSKTVHIVEDVVIADGKIKTEKDGMQETLPLSSFTWSTHFMQSFEANNLKSLDTTFYFSLKLPSSKQLFRFLDKRFGSGRAEWTFDLKQLAFEHVGLSRNYSVAKIKEKLGNSIQELEEKGFLMPLPREERYFKVTGTWKIRVIDGRCAAPPPPPESEPPPLVAELVSRGVAESAAGELVRLHPHELIHRQIEYFDWGMRKKPEKIGEPGGYLVDAIRKDYAPPKHFVSKAEEQRQHEQKQAAARQAAEEKHRKQEEAARERKKREAVEAYLRQLAPDQRAALEATILAQVSPETRRNYDNPVMAPYRETLMLGMLREYIPAMLPAELPPLVSSPPCPANAPQSDESPFELEN